jgi:hypothetical protein
MKRRAGPAGLARLGLLHKTPAEYWERYSSEAAERLRAWRPVCHCVDGRPLEVDRCRRCGGWRS